MRRSETTGNLVAETVEKATEYVIERRATVARLMAAVDRINARLVELADGRSIVEFDHDVAVQALQHRRVSLIRSAQEMSGWADDVERKVTSCP